MHDRYKVSMFCIRKNYGDNGLILYNSLKGVNSIKVIQNGMDYLKYLDKEQEYEYCDNSNFRWLIDNGYLVENNIDEKAIRDSRKAHFLEDKCLYLTIHLTQNCNFRCVYCANSFTKEKISETTQDGILKFIRKNVHNYSGIYVSWFGGEPLLELNIIETMSEKLISICEKVKKTYYAEITTNGYLLNIRNILRLVKCKVREICVTVDGSKKIHDNLRKMSNGRGTYEKIMDNLLEIVKHKANIPIKITIRMNLTKDSIGEFANHYNRLNESFGKDKRFLLYVNFVKNWGGENIEQIEDQLISEENMTAFYKQYAKNEKELKIAGCFEKLDFGGMSCMAAKRNSLVVYTDGMIGKCERPEKNNYLGKVTDKGFVYTDNLLDVWNGIAYRIEEKCDNCELSTLCFGGICSKNKILNKDNYCIDQFIIVHDLLEFYANLYMEGDQLQ